MKLDNKAAIVTGAAKGIGLGCAKILAGHGCAVAIADCDREGGEAAAKDLADQGRDVVFVPCDVTVEKDVRDAVEAAVSRFGRLDCIVNNAGWHPPAMTIDEIAVEDFEQIIRLNLTGTFMGCKYATPHLRKTKGSIVIMASQAGLIGQAAAASYAASKAGQVGLTKALALDLAPEGVRVNAICPAGVMTPMLREWASTLSDPRDAIEMVHGLHPIGRMATIEEIGEVCAFLASAEAAFVTGQAIGVDGGAPLGYRK